MFGSRREFGRLAGALGAGLTAGFPASVPGQERAGHQPTRNVARPEPRLIFGALAFGAVGDGQRDDTAALQRAVDACAAAGGGVVVLDAGHTFLSSTVVLRSHVELHLAAGSRLLTSPRRQDFHRYGSLLFAENERDVRVSGTGEIDGNFRVFFPPKGPDGYPVPQPFLGPFDPLYEPGNRNPPDGRPRMILLVSCREVLLEDFTIRDSPTWTIHPVGCDGLRISGISILNDLDVPNCDGIDIDHSRDVRVEGCNLRAGDDCVVVKASRNFGDYGPCEGVTVTGCTMESSSAGIKVETEGNFPLRSVAMTGCTIVRSNRGISFLNRDGATVEDMLFSGMTIETRMRPMMWWGSGEPVALSSVPRVRGGPAGLVRGVVFADLLCRSENGIYLRGAAEAPLCDVRLSNVELRIAKTTAVPGGFYDMRPGDAFGESGLDRRKTAGVFAANVDGLRVVNVGVHWGAGSRSTYGNALELHGCRGVVLAQVTGEAANAGDAPAVFEDVQFAREIAGPGATAPSA